jgi:type I restriction enzyme S subunit
MIEGLKPYAEYKESGQEWLGRVPAHWDVRRTKLILREVDLRSTTGKEQLLRVSQYTGVTQRKAADGSDAPDTRAASLVGYKRVAVNDLVINIMLAWNGSMGVSRFDGIASPAYCVYRLNKGAQHWYFHQLFRLPLYKGRIKAVSTGVIESRLRLYSDDLGRIEAILPPPDEQAAIVRFLDHANRKIDGFIRAKRKLIGLLNEQKQAIIYRAVTGKDEVRMVKDENGNSSFILQPSTLPKKPSGIPWLGDIPKHWEARQLRRVCRKIKTGGTPKGADEQFFEVGGFNWHTPSDFRDTIELGDASRQLSKMGVSEVTAFPADTILMIGIGATIGKVSISRKPCSCNQQINAILPNKRLVHLDFLAFYLRTLRSFIVDCGKFTTMPIINQDETKRLPVLVPPIQEQIEIAKHIELASKPFTTAIARTEREIALMQEYRTRLTADLVTGKLDVREAAAKLPDLPNETATTPEEPLEENEPEEVEA